MSSDRHEGNIAEFEIASKHLTERKETVKNIKGFISALFVMVVVTNLSLSASAQVYEYRTKPEGPLSICFSQVVMNHPFRVANVESLEAAVAQHDDIELTVTDAQGDVTQEIANIESFIARGCDAIIVSSLSGKAIYPAYQEVAQAGVPLVIAASGVPEEEGIPYVSYVATDEVAMGERAADYIANKLGGQGNLVVILGVPESTNSVLRSAGFNPQLEYWPNINVVAEQSGQWLRLPTRQVMANILQANTEIDAVFAQNDEMALGAIQAIKDAGREDEIFVVGMDAQKEGLEAIRDENVFDMTIANEWRMDTALQVAIDAVRGAPVPQRVVLKVPLINDFNIEAHYDPEATF